MLLYQAVDTKEDAVRFQDNINAKHKWATGKCFSTKLNANDDQKHKPLYKMDWVNTAKYIGVIMQSNLKLYQYIKLKKSCSN